MDPETCPYCDAPIPDLWEWFLGRHDDEEIQHECPSCGKTIRARQNITVTYVLGTPRPEGD